MTRLRLAYFVCGTPRAGTSLLTGLLKNTGVAGRPDEYFWRFELPSWTERWSLSSSAQHVARVIDAGTTPNGVFGCKLMWGYFADFLAQLRAAGGQGSDRQLIETFFPGFRSLFVRRTDVVAQAVSWAKAIQTGVWYDHITPGSGKTASFDFDQINALAREADDHNRSWRRWFVANEIEPFEVEYEELCSTADTKTRAALKFLGIDVPDDLVIQAETRRQADDLNRAWIDEYKRRFSEQRRRATRPG